MKTKTRDYRYVLKLILKEKIYSSSYAKLIAGLIIKNRNFIIKSRYRIRNLAVAPLIESSFAWGNTAQGYEFWYIIHCQLNQGISLHGETVGTNYQTIKDYINPF